jgi:hypothetical protein
MMARYARLALPLAAVLSLVCLAATAFASHIRPVSATPTRVSLVPALEPCTNPNARHVSPPQQPSCYPPRQTSKYLTVGTPDANGQPPRAYGYVRLSVFFCPQCDAPITEDLRLNAYLIDVRRLSDLGDYDGELQAKVGLQITDHYNNVIAPVPPPCDATSSCPATVTHFDFDFPVPCTPTSGAIGSTCEVFTSANAQIPGMVQELKSASWQLDQIQVFDGGADGVAGTPDNTLFQVQGVFLP